MRTVALMRPVPGAAAAACAVSSVPSFAAAGGAGGSASAVKSTGAQISAACGFAFAQAAGWKSVAGVSVPVTSQACAPLGKLTQHTESHRTISEDPCSILS